MSFHKARPHANVDPTQPAATVMAFGRVAVPHAECDGKPVKGGIQHATVGDVTRTKEEEDAKVKAFHADQHHAREVAKDTFDPKTGEPKVASPVKFGPDPRKDASTVPAHYVGVVPAATTADVKKNIEAEKKVADVKPHDAKKDEVK